MSVSYWQDNAYDRIERAYDITIIGAGLAGFSTAYWLKKLDPTLAIVIVDKGDVGAGASGRNAGFITCGSTEHFSRMSSAYGENKAEEIWKFTEYNHNLILEEFGTEKLKKLCEYNRQGSWTLATTEPEVETIQESVKLLKSKGVKVDWYNEDHILDKFRPNETHPHCISGFKGGAKYYDDGEIHPVKYLWLIADSIGIDVWRNIEVFAVEPKGDNLEVLTRQARFETSAVVLCTNAWAGQLFPWFADKISPMRGQIIVTEPVTPFLEPCYCNFVLDYFRQLVDGRVLIGGFRNADVEKEMGYSDEINPLIHEKLEGFLHEHFPVLDGKRIDYRWSGVMGFNKDGYPMVGSLSEEPRVFYNVGFTAHGLGFTFGTGELTAKLVLEGKDPGIFSGRRFDQ